MIYLWGDHVRAYYPIKTAAGTGSWKRTPPGSRENETKMAEAVSWKYCVQCRIWTTIYEDNSTTTHICRAVPLENPRGTNTPGDHTKAPDPLARVLSQYGPENSAAGGVNTKSSMESDLGGDPGIGGDSVYDVGYFSLMGQLFIGGAVTS